MNKKYSTEVTTLQLKKKKEKKKDWERMGQKIRYEKYKKKWKKNFTAQKKILWGSSAEEKYEF